MYNFNGLDLKQLVFKTPFVQVREIRFEGKTYRLKNEYKKLFWQRFGLRTVVFVIAIIVLTIFRGLVNTIWNNWIINIALSLVIILIWSSVLLKIDHHYINQAPEDILEWLEQKEKEID